MRAKRLLLAAASAVAALAVPAPAVQTGDLLLLSREGTFYHASGVDGSAMAVGTTGRWAPHVGLTRDPANVYRTVALIDPIADVYHMFDVLAVNGSTTPTTLEALQLFYLSGAAHDSAGLLWIIARPSFGFDTKQTKLWRVDPSDASARVMASTLALANGVRPRLFGLAWERGELYSWAADFGLVKVDTTNGTLTPVWSPSRNASFGHTFRAFSFDDAGLLHLLDDAGLARVDRVSGEIVRTTDPLGAAGEQPGGLTVRACGSIRLGPPLEAGSVRDATAGQRANISFTCATPNAFVFLAAGTSSGPGTIGNCPGTPLAIANPQILAVAVAQPNGAGWSSSFAIPASMAGTTVLLQALETVGCAASQVVAWTF